MTGGNNRVPLGERRDDWRKTDVNKYISVNNQEHNQHIILWDVCVCVCVCVVCMYMSVVCVSTYV